MKTPDWMKIEIKGEQFEKLKIGAIIKVRYSKHHHIWHYYKVTDINFDVIEIEKVKE